MRKNIFLILVVILVLIPNFIVFASKSNKTKSKVIIFHAGSLSVPFSKIEREYEKINPDIDIQREVSGSMVCARKITQLKKPCDIFASADYMIINKMIIPEYADFNIIFASNKIVLCFTESSNFSSTINTNNWFNILKKENVNWGFSDPNLDPCGYRTLIVMKLAEKYYNIEGLYDSLIKKVKLKNIRPKSVELISLLQTGNLDYAWEYYSVAKQHGLNFIDLPPEINLGSFEYDNLYKKASVKIRGKSGNKIEIRGKSITYGLTLLKSAPNREQAIDFLKFLLNREKGLKLIQETGQKVFDPPILENIQMLKYIPDELKALLGIKTKL